MLKTIYSCKASSSCPFLHFSHAVVAAAAPTNARLTHLSPAMIMQCHAGTDPRVQKESLKRNDDPWNQPPHPAQTSHAGTTSWQVVTKFEDLQNHFLSNCSPLFFCKRALNGHRNSLQPRPTFWLNLHRVFSRPNVTHMEITTIIH